jgi:hypothetical protein
VAGLCAVLSLALVVVVPSVPLLLPPLAFLVTLLLVTQLVSPPDVSRSATAIRFAIVTLAWLAPTAIIVLLRTLNPTCTGLNLLGLPWPEPIKPNVQVLSGLVIIGSFAGLVTSLPRAPLVSAGIVAGVYSAAMVIPTFLGYFLTVFGDPGSECIPV